MGGEGRAEALSESLGMSKQVKKWLKFLFRKCGNCPFRIICWSELFPDKGVLIEAYRKVFFCEGYKGEAKESFDGKQVVAFIKNCAPCKYLENCMVYILDSDEFIGMVEATSDDVRDHVKVLKRCAECPDNSRCWSGVLKEIGFGWHTSPRIVKIMMTCKFRKKGDD